MIGRRGASTAPILAFALVLAACGTSPTPRFYTLSAQPPAAKAVSETPVSVAVGPVSIPAVLDRPQFVVSVAPNRVELAEFDRWAEPLRNGIPRILAIDIGRELDTDRIAGYGEAIAQDADFKVSIDVVRFESVLGDGVTVEAVWIIRAKQGNATQTGHSLVKDTATGTDYAALAAAGSRALDGVAREIAATVRAMRKTQ